jgi:hypothetical protein
MINQAGPDADCVKLTTGSLFNWWKFLKQVLSKNDKVLDVYYAITPGHRADVAE